MGAGPAGITVGIAAARAGVPCILLDRRTVVSAIERYPLNMTFFSTPEKLEIGDIPFIASHEKPTRRDGLLYYRRVVEHFGLDARPGEEVTAVTRTPEGKFLARVGRRHETISYLADNIVFATGYYDWPNLLGVPGEDLPHVSHYFLEGHRHWHQDVVVVGAGNSAVDAALECWRAGARVTLVHIAEGFDRTVKPWVLPDITNRVKEGSIGAHWHSRIVAIHPDRVEVEQIDGGTRTAIPADQVLAMTGYYASTDLISSLGVPVDHATGVPAHDPATMMTPVPSCYIAGVMAAGRDANRLFIENTRQHGGVIVEDIRRRTGA
ncbi:MAG: YpdA family putative bacillithiol disulfide reductase [Gemmatimonadota bacterium]|nr:YpdA family putative bacillithiol disulfide reductase [Gemmatimonadota bacterium]MDH5284196.1 YpdA family putative bacillithiol disulfide reductase [Gemmatimonadota bacterium]